MRQADRCDAVDERERLYESFRNGETKVLVVSKVATSASTCPRRPSRSRSPDHSDRARKKPSASVACCGQKKSGLPANFYTLVARDTVDQDFAQNRQRFLAEQGYS